jgi:acyl-CoA oxidase
LHAISSATKPKTGWFATECIKESRQALGGHGFSSYSKLGTLYNDHDVNNTWEGDNTVLLQQSTKYIFENAKKAMKK